MGRHRRIPSTRGVDPWPDKFICNMTYDNSINATGISSSLEYRLRGNSIFDVDQVNTGNQQPTGYTTFSSLYGRYNVLWNRIKMTWWNQTVDVGSVMMIKATYDSSFAGDENDMMAQRGTKRRIGTAKSGAHPAITVSMKRKTTSVVGVSAFDDSIVAAMGANPSKEWYWYVKIIGHDAATILLGRLEIHITYRVLLSERKTLTV